MRVGISILSIVAAAGLACPVLAQDSISNNSNGGNGLPGDALNPWVVGVPNQRAAYVVDMTPLFTSQGTQFGNAPVIKTSKTNSAFFSSLWSAQSISNTLIEGGYHSASYRYWNAPTAGVNPEENNIGLTTVVTPSGLAAGLAVGITEFSTSNGGFNVNNNLGGLINYNASMPGRLFVTRVVAAVNMANGVTGDTSQVGYGAVDSHGNMYIRADDFGVVGPPAMRIAGVNYLRVRLTGGTGRNPAVLNQIINTGGSDAPATDWQLINQPSATNQHNTPNAIPRSVAGRPVLLGSNFNNQYVHEKFPYPAALTTEAVGAHLVAPATGHRGGVSYSHKDLFFTGGGMAGLLGVGVGGTDTLSLWALDPDGDFSNRLSLTLPAAVDDPCDTASFSGVFDGYRSQVAARGGNGQIALGQDQKKRGMAAATVYTTANAQNPVNAIAVARFDPADPANTTEWTLAAWTDTSFDGKPIHGDFGNDGAPFSGDPGEFDAFIDNVPTSPTYDAPIGRLTLAPAVPGLIGPSMSSPTMDSVGNIYFLSIVELKKYDSVNQTYFIDVDTALIRAIYEPDQFCYNLDLMMELGDTFLGANSNRKYQVQFLETSDSNSISSGSLWSGNANQATWNNINVPPYRFTRAAENLGGLVVAAKIVYDVNGDSLYEDPTSAGGNVNSVDEAYNVLFYIGNMNPPMCPADFNNDGFVDGIDSDQFNNAFESNDPAIQMMADFNNDGFVDGIDSDQFNNAFEAGC